MTATAQRETRGLRLNENILLDIIFSQAGTLAKAILEAVMNAVDAGATECRIDPTFTGVTIRDDGCGIQNREDIITRFEEFGTPQSAEEKKQKVFGRFRMGRGQLFAFGANTWRTGTFEMQTDVKGEGLVYHLLENQPAVPGCRIDVKLYEKLTPSSFAETERTVADWVKYVPLKIYWNDELITVDPALEQWDHVLPEAFIRLKTSGSLSVYNLGVHTMEIPSYRFGTGGLIVSRQQLQVNFARNDVVDSCPVWKKIKPFVQQQAEKKIAKKTTKLTDDERQRAADRMRSGEMGDREEFRKLRVFTTVNGRQISYQQMCDYKCSYKVTACAAGDPLGDQFYRNKVATVLSEETLDRFRVADVTALVRLLARTAPTGTIYSELVPVKFADLADGFDREFVLVDQGHLTPSERMWMDILERSKLQLRLSTEESRGSWTQQAASRRVLVGIGPADAWTDGNSFVAISRHYLCKRELTLRGFVDVGLLLLDMFCSGEKTNTSGVRDHEFYQLFHESADSLSNFVADCLIKLPKVFKAAERRLSSKQLEDQDRLAVAAGFVPTATSAETGVET